MNDHRAQVLADLRELIRGAQDNRVAYTLASRYCPDQWGKPLAEIADSFHVVESRLQDVYSQVEALFDERG